MVFDPFRIDLGGAGWDAEPEEEGEDDLVALAGLGGEGASGGGEVDRAVGLGLHESVPLESSKGSTDGDMADPEVVG